MAAVFAGDEDHGHGSDDGEVLGILAGEAGQVHTGDAGGGEAGGFGRFANGGLQFGSGASGFYFIGGLATLSI